MNLWIHLLFHIINTHQIQISMQVLCIFCMAVLEQFITKFIETNFNTIIYVWPSDLKMTTNPRLRYFGGFFSVSSIKGVSKISRQTYGVGSNN